MTHMHSYAHVNELGYQAVRRALGISTPVSRDPAGRFISRRETKAAELRSELAAANNQSLEEAIAVLNRQTGEGGEVTKLKVLDLFSGIGGFSLGLERTGGFETVAFCEIDPFCRRVLAKHWPDVPCFEDVTTLRGESVGPVDVICGGFPCQDISYAGPGDGLAGRRSGLWFEYARLVGELGPKVVIVENVAALLDRGMDAVLGTLSALGYDAEWDTVSACSVGHPHMRRRVFIVAYANGFDGRQGVRHSLARAFRALQTGDGFESARARSRARLANPSELYGGADGLPDGMDRNHAIGNAIVPAIPELIGNAILASMEA